MPVGGRRHRIDVQSAVADGERIGAHAGEGGIDGGFECIDAGEYAHQGHDAKGYDECSEHRAEQVAADGIGSDA